ncbi:MAG: hypothetical protein JW951_03050 [Lentisphaerae bacterium]|nr:hypothetical protein [Lentisphaerota bacterium]
MSFCTAINCMDGRAQLPVIRFLQKRFDAEYVDIVSEPGPNRILAGGEDQESIASIERRVRISVQQHGSNGVAVIGHDDCAGNPAPEAEQNGQTLAAVRRLRATFPEVPVIGLWLKQNGDIDELEERTSDR